MRWTSKKWLFDTASAIAYRRDGKLQKSTGYVEEPVF
jgi:hypothetical protein